LSGLRCLAEPYFHLLLSEYEEQFLIFFHVFSHAVKYVSEDLSFNLGFNIIMSLILVSSHFIEMNLVFYIIQ